MIGIREQRQCRAFAELLADRLELIERRQVVARALQEEHRDLHLEQMLGTVLRWLAGRVQRKSEEGQSVHALERSVRLRLRGHPAAERLAAGDERHVRQQTLRRGHRGTDRCLRERRRVGPLAAALHVGKLIAQRGKAARREPARHIVQEGMIHSCAGAMRQHVASSRAGWLLQQARNVSGIADGDADRFVAAEVMSNGYGGRCQNSRGA